jgi:hypothetical protein
MTDEQIDALKQAVESVLEYADYWQPYPPSVIDDARAILAHIDAQAAEIARLREAIAGPAAWLDSWAQHVGNCQGGYVCTCGLVRARSELSAILAQETKP